MTRRKVRFHRLSLHVLHDDAATLDIDIVEAGRRNAKSFRLGNASHLLCLSPHEYTDMNFWIGWNSGIVDTLLLLLLHLSYRRQPLGSELGVELGMPIVLLKPLLDDRILAQEVDLV